MQERLRLQVSVISGYDYEALRYKFGSFEPFEDDKCYTPSLNTKTNEVWIIVQIILVQIPKQMCNI